MVGRPPKPIRIISVRDLEVSEVVNVKRGRVPAVQRFRDSHHRMAQLFASGLKTHEVASVLGYSLSRVSTLRSSPAFDDLVAQKRSVDEEALKDPMQLYNQMILENGIKADRKLADKLDDDDDTEELSVRELLSISRDAADRVGLSKRSIQMNIDGSFASLLDRAIARSREVLPRSADVKLIESASTELSSGLASQSAGRGSLSEIVSTSTSNHKVINFKRRM